VADEFSTVGDGLRATYRDGRKALRRARREPTDEHLHEWRKSVKYLWYQTRLLRDVAPSVLRASIEQLDLLSEALGDDHDLAVLVAGLDADPDRFGDAAAVDHTRLVARQQQQELRRGAFRAGAIVFAEPADAFTARLRRYWRIRVDDGPEVTVGGIAELAEAVEETGSPSTIERERKYLVEQVPSELDLSDRVELRQGYLVTGERVAVRVRDAGREGRTLTIKAGRGTSSAERTELEWRIGKEQFEAVWPLTEGRRVVKTRHRIPAAGLVIELDVFGEQLDGLIIAEVEFSSMEALESFVSPDWFGPEVTDDRRYTNAALANSGLPDPSA
jgi:CYTH domain-containing protein